MEKIRCECGHDNPIGTKLCAVCGRALTEEEQQKKLADMRYDGIAIRSKTHNKSIIDKIWNFFSSVKVGIALIIINLVAASIGTILPQEFYISASNEVQKEQYYTDLYGSFGSLYYNLGLSDVYSSWWFQVLVLLLGVSIIIASIDRGVPLHKSLKNQRVKRHENFMKRQRIIAEGKTTVEQANTLDVVEEKLKGMRYNVRREGNALMAEKNRLSRYGPYINHVGLIVFLVGVMLRLVPGFHVDESIWVRENEMRAVPGMEGYFIYNEDFILETHDNQAQGEQLKQGVNVVAKNFQTNAILYRQVEGSLPGQTDNLEEVLADEIRVNHPLKYEGYAFYQMDYRLNELYKMTFALTNKATGESLGEVTIDLSNPETEYVIDDNTKIQIVSYYPDFSGFKDGEPQTASPTPNNPAFIFRMFTPDTPDGETSFVAIQNTIPIGDNQYKMSFVNAETRDMTGLTIRKDKTIPILFVGGFIFMLGVVIGSYWAHRRIWIEELEDGTIRLAAHTNKNWFGIKKELDVLTEATHLPAYTDLVDLEKEKEKEKEGDNTL
mgnify:FL=1